MSSRRRYSTVVFDVDSTVAGLEGIDWLARLRGPDVAAHCVELTHQAMDGAVPLETVYGERLTLIAPTKNEADRLAQAYVESVAPGCREAMAALRGAGVHVVLISGGLRPALLPLAFHLGVPAEDVHAVEVRFSADGSYAGFDATSPLARNGGKPAVLETLALPRPILAVGDGATDIEMSSVADTFAAFTGFARRESVVRAASIEFLSFPEIATFVLDGSRPLAGGM
jgi:phosphoserine phosphatase